MSNEWYPAKARLVSVLVESAEDLRAWWPEMANRLTCAAIIELDGLRRATLGQDTLT